MYLILHTNGQLPDGVRTNGVVAEVPQFPHSKYSWGNVTKCGTM